VARAATEAAMSARKVRGGIDLGGTKIQAAVVDGRWQVIAQARRPTPTAGGPEDVAAQMAATMAEAARDAGVDPASLLGIGVGSPGEVDERTGAVSQARNLPGWEGSFALGRWLTKALGPPVAVGNDVQVATMAEAKLGAGRPYRSLLGVFWGTGVGGGIVIDDRPWLGRGSAAEIGHMVVKKGGARCTCGRRGCMEAYAGRAAMEIKARRDHKAGAKTDLFKIMRERGRDRLTSGIWERALHADDPLATKLIDRAIEALGAGIASAANLLDPEAVVIGGGIGVRLGEPYVKRIRKQMLQHLFTSDDPAPVHVAALGDLGGAIGAALLTAGDGSSPERAVASKARRAPRAASAR
jgi:glucokinase